MHTKYTLTKVSVPDSPQTTKEQKNILCQWWAAMRIKKNNTNFYTKRFL